MCGGRQGDERRCDNHRARKLDLWFFFAASSLYFPPSLSYISSLSFSLSFLSPFPRRFFSPSPLFFFPPFSPPFHLRLCYLPFSLSLSALLLRIFSCLSLSSPLSLSPQHIHVNSTNMSWVCTSLLRGHYSADLEFQTDTGWLILLSSNYLAQRRSTTAIFSRK